MTGWKEVKRGELIDHNLEKFPLQIKTRSAVGSQEQLAVWFENANEGFAGGLFVYFTSPLSYLIDSCTESDISDTSFPSDIPTDIDKIWTLTLIRTSETQNLVITCNNKEVLNFSISETTCTDAWWPVAWTQEVKKIKFLKEDNASDFYRPG